MLSRKEFDISFIGLKDGAHEFQYEINKEFFENQLLDEFIDCEIRLLIKMDKTPNMLVLNFFINGSMTFPCDRCLDDVVIPIKTENVLFVKFSDAEAVEEDDVMIISNNAHDVNVGQYVFENIMLSLPQKKVHDLKSCNQEIMQQLNLHVAKAPEGVDPRWNELDKLKL